MINELYQLTQAMSEARIGNPTYHAKYIPIPNVSEKAPCVRIIIEAGKVLALENVNGETAKIVRKYGSNQGTFPAMNLAPLYRISDEKEKEILGKAMRDPEKYLHSFLPEILQWTERDGDSINWADKKFRTKYANSMESVPRELKALLKDPEIFPDLFLLMEQMTDFFAPDVLFEELKRESIHLLQTKEGADKQKLALQILFYAEKTQKNSEPDNGYGTLSAVFDCDLLTHSTVGRHFTSDFNQALLSRTQTEKSSERTDAFGMPFVQDDSAMPKVKLAAGFSPILRTMNTGAIPSLTRYGHGDKDTYPLSTSMRLKLASALAWIGEEEGMEGITWTRTGVKDEALFAYPSSLPEVWFPFTKQFRRGKTEEAKNDSFKKEAKSFISHMRDWKLQNPETYPESIQIFLIRKLDKGHTKTVYRTQVTPEHLMNCGEEWGIASRNLPRFSFFTPDTPYPLQIAGILNQIWKQDGTPVSDKFQAVPSCHGVALQLSRTTETVKTDLRLLIRNSGNLAAYAGNRLHIVSYSGFENNRTFFGLRDSLTVLGMLLYWVGIKKEDYMESNAYLFGQLLQLSDSLHELYCQEVRDGKLPPQLMGSSLYNAAAELPARTFSQLGERMKPYISWAKTHRSAQAVISHDGKEDKGYRAAALLRMIGDVAARLGDAPLPNRFGDQEKAELFIGYMAAVTYRTKTENQTASAEKDEGNSE